VVPSTSIDARDESRRLAAVERYEVLTSSSDSVLDALTRAAASVFGVPIALVSLVGADRIRFLARHGIDLDQVERFPGLCGSAITGDGTWVVVDAADDRRARSNPLVAGEHGIRFYVGQPLTTRDGDLLGTLCVLDTEPHDITDHQVATLRELADVVVQQLDLRLESRHLVHAYETRLHEVQRLADALQHSLLPPRMPVIPYLNVAASYNPASAYEVGGDFYDVFPVDTTSWALVIGDVCGKGPVAASRTSGARYSLRAAAIQQHTPAETLGVVNQALLRDTGAAPDAPFVTALYARIEPHVHGTDLVLASAGHPPPLVVRASGEVETVGAPGTLLGVFDSVSLTDSSVSLEPGDLVVFYTDGLTDSGTVRLEQAGVREVLQECAGLSPTAVVDRLRTAVESAQRDDIALVAVRCDAVG
jgi:sigma-B regulation protein RsbU (phosphoserine phosphatase)